MANETIAIPADLRRSLERTLLDTGRLCRRALAYALHLRETNLAEMLRHHGPPGPEHIWAELRQRLVADLENFAQDQAANEAAAGLGLFRLGAPEGMVWTEAADALRLLDADRTGFLDRYLAVVEGKAEKGLHSVTSR